jgi:hypothetical protein
MKTEELKACRDAFEKWMKDNYGIEAIRYADNDTYYFKNDEDQWKIWRAAWIRAGLHIEEKTIQRCVKVCQNGYKAHGEICVRCHPTHRSKHESMAEQSDILAKKLDALPRKYS